MKVVRELDGKSSQLRWVIISNVLMSLLQNIANALQIIMKALKNIFQCFAKRWQTIENALRMHWKSLSMHLKSIDNALKNGSTVVSVKGRFHK